MKKFLEKLGYSQEIEYSDKLLYFLVFCSIFVSGVFLILYGVFIPFRPAIFAHGIYFSLSLILYIPLKYGYNDIVRYLVVIFHIIQLSLSVFIWFPYDTGFGIYYLMVPMCGFIIMKYSEMKQRIFAISASILASALYYISETLDYDFYLYKTSDKVNDLFSKLSILSILVPMIYIFTMLARSNYLVNKELKMQAEVDSLTQIYNRRVLYKNGRQLFEDVKYHNKEFSLILFDLDFFKKINDVYGHQTGDVLLVELTSLIGGVLSSGDIFARYGGEEFAILIKNKDYEESYFIAEKIQNIVRKTIFEIDDNKVQITISIGLVEYNYSIIDFDEMVKLADKALYKAKENGRNQIQTENVS